MQALPQTLAHRLISIGMAKPAEIVGLSDDEIATLEERLGLTLPVAYKYFLSIMGRSAGNFELDAMWTVDALPLARIRAQALMQESLPGDFAPETEAEVEPFVLPAEAHVFLASAYDFIYFDCAAGQDPPVYLFQAGDREPSNSLPSFSEWLRNSIEELGPEGPSTLG